MKTLVLETFFSCKKTSVRLIALFEKCLCNIKKYLRYITQNQTTQSWEEAVIQKFCISKCEHFIFSNYTVL